MLFSADHEGRILSWSMQKVKFGPLDEPGSLTSPVAKQTSAPRGEEKKEPTWRDFMKARGALGPARHTAARAMGQGSSAPRRLDGLLAPELREALKEKEPLEAIRGGVGWSSGGRRVEDVC